MDYQAIKSKRLVRKAIIKAAYKAGETHVGSALSCAEIMEALYFRVANVTKDNCKSETRDRILISKGHAALAQYACLMLKGIIPEDVFETYSLDGGLLPAHLDRSATDGIEASTGMSLGHGIGLAEGFALANRLKKIKARLFVIVGDGELQEGSIWEGLASVKALGLNEITVILDRNGMQASAQTKEIVDNSNLSGIFEQMGFSVETVNGHDVDAIAQALEKTTACPLIVIADTIKGYGLPAPFENTVKSHYVKLTPEQYQAALKAMDGE